MKRRYHDVRGIRMHWREAGKGPPVVMVHGIATSPSLWRYVMPHIMNAHCLAWEMVGYGGSIPQGRDLNLSAAREADYLIEWFKTLRIKRAVLVGHGLGGGVVQIAAKKSPTVCAGLVLINSVGYDNWPTAEVKFARRFPGLIGRMPETAFRFFFRRLLRLGHVDRLRAAQAFEVHWPYYARYGARAFVQQARYLDLRDTRELIPVLRNLNVPVSVIWGARDRQFPAHYGFRFARDLDATFHYILKSRHFVPEDHPEVVADAINHVLAQVYDEAHPRQRELRHRYG